ncbi:SRPBCC family protein [Nocardia sp. NPDC003482]
MKLENSFSIPVPAADAWPVLLDLERIAPCVPGAVLTSREGDDFHGKIKVKLGPVGLTYTGVIKVLSQDEQARVAVLEGGGRETRGNGTAKAVVTCRMVENGGATDVFVETDLAITGKPAQFGRGVLADVAGTLIGRFADNLAAEISASVPADPVAAQREQGGGTQREEGDEGRITPARPAAEPIDLIRAAGMGGNRELGLTVAVVALGLLSLVLLLLRRRTDRT